MKKSDDTVKTLDPFMVTWLESTKREVRRANDGSSAFLDCNYNAPLEKVWEAITNRDKLAKWFGKVSGDMSQGAELTFYLGVDISSRVLAFEPFHKLVLTWLHPGREEDKVKIRLKANSKGTLLELEQFSKDKTDWWFGAGAGWESALVRLSLLLQGDNPRRISDDTFDQVLGPLWTIAGKASA